MKRWRYEDAERPWEPDGVLRKYVARAPWPVTREERPKALDLGMGYGRNAVWLAERGFEVEGWEIEGRYVLEARREMRERVKRWRGEKRNSKLEALRLRSGQARNSAEGKAGVAGETGPREKQVLRPPRRAQDDGHGVERSLGRLRVRHGDFARGEWRGPYDVIVISQALHQLKRSEALRVLRQAKRALKSGGRLFLLAKLTRDNHVRRVAESEEWERVRGEKNTWRRLKRNSKLETLRLRSGQARNSAERGPEFHIGRPRRRWQLLSALTRGEIRGALRGLRLVHYQEVVLRSDWEENEVVTHTVAEVVGEKK